MQPKPNLRPKNCRGLGILKGPSNSTPDPREDPKSRSPNLGPYTTKGTFLGTPIKGSAFWILPGVWDSISMWFRSVKSLLHGPFGACLDFDSRHRF